MIVTPPRTMLHGGLGGGQTSSSDATVPSVPTSLTVITEVVGRTLGGVGPRSATIQSWMVSLTVPVPKSGETKHLVQPTLSEQRAQLSNSGITKEKSSTAGSSYPQDASKSPARMFTAF